MSAEVSFTKRAAAELSRCFNGISVTRQNKNKSSPATSSSSKDQVIIKPLISETTQLINCNNKSCANSVNNKTSKNCAIIGDTKPLLSASPTGTPVRRVSRAGQTPPQAPPKTWRARRKNYLLSVDKAKYLDELWSSDAKFLFRFFHYFTPLERCVLVQVCKKWKEVMYKCARFWCGLTPVIHCNELRHCQHSLTSLSSFNNEDLSPPLPLYSSSAVIDEIKANLYNSIDIRCFDSICLFGATDGDIIEFASKVPPSVLKRFTSGSLRNASVSDKGLEIFLTALAQSIVKLELSGCNEISDSGLWTEMVPTLDTLIILDCINISDETIAAICQMLHSLRKLQLQAYHVTDTSMAYFGSTCARDNLRALFLHHCWELTNQGVASLSHGLPNLHSLSLSGCSKVSDDAIEVIAEQIRGLRYLDLSWCPRVSDAALEYIACDLSDTLNQLILDRCLHITDIGIGYVATMTNLIHLSLRWCPQIRDFGLQTICSMRTLKVLSIAGCPQLTVSGLSCLVQMQQLSELELTNCPAATKELIKYLRDNLPPTCSIIV